MSDDPKQPTPPHDEPLDDSADRKTPPFDPDYDLITDMERSPKHDLSKRERRPNSKATR